MFGQNKPPHFTDPKYEEKMRKYNARKASIQRNNRNYTGVSPVPFISIGVILVFAIIIVISTFQDDPGSSEKKALSNETITADEDYNFEIIADKEIKADRFDNVLIETEYTLFPEYEDSIIYLNQGNYFEEAPTYSEALTDIKSLSKSGKSEEVDFNGRSFTYSDKIHPIFSSAIVTMTFRSTTNTDDSETVSFLVENSNRPDSEKSLAQLDDINQELAAISAEEEALEEAERIAKEAEYEKEQAEQEQANQEREALEEAERIAQQAEYEEGQAEQDQVNQEKEDNRYVQVSKGDGVHKWEVFIEAGRSLRVWGTNDDLITVIIYDEFGNRMDNDYTTAPNFDFYLSTKSSYDHVVQLEIEFTSSIDYNLSVE